MQRAAQIAIESGQHVFDRLFHAVAIEQEDATPIAADDRYHAKAERYGRILRLKNWRASHDKPVRKRLEVPDVAFESSPRLDHTSFKFQAAHS